MDLETIQNKIITIRNQQVIIDSDVAMLYGVQTKEINQAVKNNPEKFPPDFIIELIDFEKNELVKNFDRFNKQKHSTSAMKAFTEQGLYMLATILKSDIATKTTIAIIRTFAKLRELSRTIASLPKQQTQEQQKSLLQKGGELVNDLLFQNLETTETETTYKINLFAFGLEHSVKKVKKERDITPIET